MSLVLNLICTVAQIHTHPPTNVHTRVNAHAHTHARARARFGRYPPLWGGNVTASGAAPASPDPLVAYRWNDSALKSVAMQQYRLAPTVILGTIPNGFTGASSLLRDAAGTPSMVVANTGSIAFDFGVECAGWIEVESPDLASAMASGDAQVLLSSSECVSGSQSSCCICAVCHGVGVERTLTATRGGNGRKKEKEKEEKGYGGDLQTRRVRFRFKRVVLLTLARLPSLQVHCARLYNERWRGQQQWELHHDTSG